MITELLMQPGKWSLSLIEQTPRSILNALDLRTPGVGFAHIVITPVRLLSILSDADMLAVSRYTGVYRSQPSELQISGAGVNMWMWDEDGKGTFNTGTLSTASGTFAQWAAALKPAFLDTGLISSISGTFNTSYAAQNLQLPTAEVCKRFAAEWRVTNAFKFDIGTQADLYRTTPRALVVRNADDAGGNLNLTGIVGKLNGRRDVEDWVRGVRLYSTGGSLLATANGAIPDDDVAYRAPNGTVIRMDKAVTARGSIPAGSEQAMADGEYNAVGVKSPRQQFTLTADDYDIGQDVRVGDMIWAFDPIRGFRDFNNAVPFNGEIIYPEAIRCVGYTWPVQQGMGVYLRTYNDNNTSQWTTSWIDLTDYIEFESRGTTVEVGALARNPLR